MVSLCSKKNPLLLFKCCVFAEGPLYRSMHKSQLSLLSCRGITTPPYTTTTPSVPRLQDVWWKSIIWWQELGVLSFPYILLTSVETNQMAGTQRSTMSHTLKWADQLPQCCNHFTLMLRIYLSATIRTSRREFSCRLGPLPTLDFQELVLPWAVRAQSHKQCSSFALNKWNQYIFENGFNWDRRTLSLRWCRRPKTLRWHDFL